MADYWIADAEGRVLGPVSLPVLKTLITTGRLAGINQVSVDRGPWAPLTSRPELADVQAALSPDARHARERQEAAKLREELKAMRLRSPEQVFGVPANASADTCRLALFRLVKRYFPDTLPADAAEELRQVYTELFTFLSGLMSWVEKKALVQRAPVLSATASPPPKPAGAPAPTPSAFARPSGPPASAQLPTPPAFARPAAPAASAKLPTPASIPVQRAAAARPLTDFIGIERRDGERIAVDIRVTWESSGVFTDTRVGNLSRGGAFIPCSDAQSLGTKVELTLHFDEPAKTMKVQGKVAWWSAGDAKKARGFGVTFTEFNDADRGFLEGFLEKVKAAKR